MNGFVRYIKFIACFICAAVMLSACGGPKTISDRDMRSIFKDVFVANAYLQNVRGNDPVRDSLDVYRPILAKYGYKMGDFEYTLANFSKRKSVRISSVVEQAIQELENEESWYRYRASILDTIDMRAQRFFGREILRDSSVRATRIADTAHMKIVLPVVPGIYEVSYYYDLDSLDKNRGLKTSYIVTDRDGKATSTNNTFLSFRRRNKVDMKISPTFGDSLLTIRFGNYPEGLTTPRLSIDSVKIQYKPELEAALDSMDRFKLRYRENIEQWVR